MQIEIENDRDVDTDKDLDIDTDTVRDIDREIDIDALLPSIASYRRLELVTSNEPQSTLRRSARNLPHILNRSTCYAYALNPEP